MEVLMEWCRFGWTNGSYSYGVSIIPEDMKKALGEGKSYEEFANGTKR